MPQLGRTQRERRLDFTVIGAVACLASIVIGVAGHAAIGDPAGAGEPVRDQLNVLGALTAAFLTVTLIGQAHLSRRAALPYASALAAAAAALCVLAVIRIDVLARDTPTLSTLALAHLLIVYVAWRRPDRPWLTLIAGSFIVIALLIGPADSEQSDLYDRPRLLGAVAGAAGLALVIARWQQLGRRLTVGQAAVGVYLVPSSLAQLSMAVSAHTSDVTYWTGMVLHCSAGLTAAMVVVVLISITPATARASRRRRRREQRRLVQRMLDGDVQLGVSFEAVYDSRSGRPAGHEALVRFPVSQYLAGCSEWRQAARRIGAGEQLERVVARQVVDAAGALPVGQGLWCRMPLGAVTDEHCQQLLCDAAAHHGVVIVELSDPDPQKLAALAGHRQTLAARGVQVAVDETWLDEAPEHLRAGPDFIKVDARHSVEELDELAGYADMIGARLVAEHVPDQATLGRLADRGVRFGRGPRLTAGESQLALFGES